MEWIQVVIYTSSYGIEPVCGVLYNLGLTGLEIEDYDDFKNFLEDNHALWDYVDEKLAKEKSGETCIKLYLPDDTNGYETLNAVKSAIVLLKNSDSENQLGRLDVSLGHIKEEDWCNNWKQYFKPLFVGKNILICPDWEEIPPNSEKTIFKINPGMSFGTGSHETTQLCIEEMENYIKPGHTVLDLGCGSGILSIIAMLLGAKEATAIDIDTSAVEIAQKNAEKNGISACNYHTIAGNIINDSGLCKKISQNHYDIIFANIVADVIIALKPIVYNFMDDDTVLITSGIINSRLDDVLNEYKNSPFEIRKISEKGEWASLTLTKRL